MFKINPSTAQTSLVTSNREKSKTLELDKSKFAMQESNDVVASSDKYFEEDLEDDIFLGGYLTCCGSFRFFVKHSWTDIGRHKCQFCLAFCSVFVVVLSVIVVNAVIAKGPLIFLRLAE